MLHTTFAIRFDVSVSVVLTDSAIEEKLAL